MPVFVRGPLAILLVLFAAEARAEVPAFRVRPYLQNPAPDAMTIRWLSETGDAGRVTCNGIAVVSKPLLQNDLDYQPAELNSLRHPRPPFLHSVRIEGLEPATSYPYSVEQSGEVAKAILTTAPRPGEVGKGGGVRLFFYADAKTQPESRGNRTEWPPTSLLPGGPRPAWVHDQYLADETTGYRVNLALMASQAAESLRDGNPVLASIVGDLVESGGEQRDWDEFWRHNAGIFGTFASRVPIVAALGNQDIFGGPPARQPQRDLGGYGGAATLAASQKFLAYFEHPENGAEDERHIGRYHRIDFGPVTLLTLDTTNGGTDDGPDDTNHALDRLDAPHIPDYGPESAQRLWLTRELVAARKRGAITLVQFHHAPWSSGPHGRRPGAGADHDDQSGSPLRALAGLLKEYGVRAVFSGHDEMYERSEVDGVHYYDVGIGGDGLSGPDPDAVNERQVFLAHDGAPERWSGNVLESGGRHYGHVEVDVAKSADGGFRVTISPVHVFPILDPDSPGEILRWERRVYDDVVVFDVARTEAAP